MPTPALPQPWPRSLPGRVRFRRVYTDALGRPVKEGTATFRGTARSSVGDVIVPVAPVTTTLRDGVLDVELPADTYRLSAVFYTVDGHRVVDEDTFTLTDPSTPTETEPTE